MTERLMAFTRLSAAAIVLAVALAFGNTEHSLASSVWSCNGPSHLGCAALGGVRAASKCIPEDPKAPDCTSCWERTNSGCGFLTGPMLEGYTRSH